MFKIDFKVIIAAVLIGIFVFEYISMPFLSNNNPDTPIPSSQQYVGTAVFGAVMDYYERTLYAENLDYETVEKIKNYPQVNEITPETGGYKISLKRKEDVLEVYNKLKDENITSYAIAKITTDPQVTMRDEDNNNITGYFYNRMVKLPGIEPIFGTGSNLWIKAQVAIQNEQAYILENPAIYLEKIQIPGEGTILSKKTYYEYNIEWDKRNDINLEELYANYGKENVYFEKNNRIFFSTNLSVQEQITKKFGYVTYITESMALLQENFTDKNRIIADFGENITFSNSSLRIIGTGLALDSDFNRYQVYEISLDVPDYILMEKDEIQNIAYNQSFELESNVSLVLGVVVTGNNIVQVEEIYFN